MDGKQTVDDTGSDKTMTVEAILKKVEWLKEQAEKNRAFLYEGETSVVPKEYFKFVCLAHEYMDRIDECVSEYSRLAAEYIHFKGQVKSQWQQLESLVRATSSVFKGRVEDGGSEEQ